MEMHHQVHDKDENCSDLSSTHRLPTISAADALEDLDHHASRLVSTGIDELDSSLVYSDSHEGAAAEVKGGLPRGQVTEVWGPPASGKTAFGIQLTANALVEGQAAVWVDCANVISGQRINAAVAHALQAPHPGPESGPESPDHLFAHYHCPSLPHLIALLCRPTATTLPPNTAVVVIDSLSVLVNNAFPRHADNKPGASYARGPGLSAKRLQTLQYLISALQKLAATRNCAVVILSQCATKLQSESGATLVPAIHATVWEQGISTRLVLFRDWVWRNHEPSTTCFAGIQKLEGKSGPEAMQSVAAFSIETTGLIGVHHDASQASVAVPAGSQSKRKHDETGLEVPDSDEDDEDYGWQDEDNAYAPIPPQTQGSEDLIIGVNRYEEEEEDDKEDGGDVGDDSSGHSGRLAGECPGAKEEDLDNLAGRDAGRHTTIDRESRRSTP